MDELISRQSAIDGLDRHRVEHRHLNDWQVGWNDALDWVKESYLENMPSVQPERKTGHWIKTTARWGRVYYCDQCRNYLVFDGVNAGRGSANFCPNCGANMRGEQDG